MPTASSTKVLGALDPLRFARLRPQPVKYSKSETIRPPFLVKASQFSTKESTKSLGYREPVLFMTKTHSTLSANYHIPQKVGG